MFLSKLDAMSVGPLWVLRDRKTPSPEEIKSEVEAVCPECKKVWYQQTEPFSSVITIVATMLEDESEMILMKNCLAAANHSDVTFFSLHASCFNEMNTTLSALNALILAKSPELIIIFGHDAARLVDPSFVPGKIHRYANTLCIVTHHPAEMIAMPALKAQVWADLCLAYSANE